MPYLNKRTLTGVNQTKLNLWGDGKMASWCFWLLLLTCFIRGVGFSFEWNDLGLVLFS